jgi:hypothetical protein
MTKKKRKAYQGPKYISKNPMKTFFGGMSDTHAEHLQVTRTINHAALQAMAQGRGDKEQWDRINGAINIALVMVEQGIGREFRDEFLAARDAMLAVALRSAKLNGRFVLTGDELHALNTAMDSHDAQLINVRALDIDRAAAEVIRRMKHHIGTQSVNAEIARQEAA